VPFKVAYTFLKNASPVAEESVSVSDDNLVKTKMPFSKITDFDTPMI
jgi:hypothetical protein